MHTVDHFGNEGWFNYDRVIIWMRFVCLLANSIQCVNEKIQFLGFLFHNVMLKP